MKNSVSLIGNIGKDAKVTEFESGKAVINFSLATSKTFTNSKDEKVSETTWHQCEVWTKKDKTGLADYITSGKLVSIDGSIKMGSYTKEVGGESIEIPTTTIVVDKVHFLNKKEAAE